MKAEPQSLLRIKRRAAFFKIPFWISTEKIKEKKDDQQGTYYVQLAVTNELSRKNVLAFHQRNQEFNQSSSRLDAEDHRGKGKKSDLENQSLIIFNLIGQSSEVPYTLSLCYRMIFVTKRISSYLRAEGLFSFIFIEILT